MTESRRVVYKVAVSGDEKMECEYEIRGLTEDEIPQWAEFCASVFSYKANPPPPSYFARHYNNDPTRVPSLIRVALFQGRMVASCRLFLRTISRGKIAKNSTDEKDTELTVPSHLSAGGIGEVCTAQEHRKRGLSKALLQNVLEIMEERKLDVSLLHAAPTFFPVYEKAGGYACTTSFWSVLTVHSTSKLQKAADQALSIREAQHWIVRNAQFPDDTEQLLEIHKTYSESRFAGCIVRSPKYWNEYLSVELENSLWVLEDLEQKAILGWLSIRQRGDRIQLREYGYQTAIERTRLEESTIFTLLLARAVQNLSPAHEKSWKLALPTSIRDCLFNQSIGLEASSTLSAFIDWKLETRDDDLGWMYKVLNSSVLNIDAIKGFNVPHLIWPSDSF